MTKQFEYEAEVLVVGSGPTGGALALALATYGINVHVVSQWNWLANSPRAHITNQRTMEVFREFGIESEILKFATPWAQMGDTVFATSLAGREIARLRTWGTGDQRHGEYVLGSPSPMVDIPQALVEPILVKNAAERGARIHLNTAYLHHVQDATGVTVTLRDRLTSREYEVRARYLVGADGSRSKVATDIDLPTEGHLAREGFAYAMFRADLSHYVKHRPSILYWMVSEQTGFGEIGMGLLRAVTPWNEWIAGWGFDMHKGEPDLTPETVTQRIRTLIGNPEIDIELTSTSTWYVNQQYATKYSEGRVFCAGDAVHRHPPSSGLGSNTCIQDAFNLAWKLAFVVKGHAGELLLETFSEERVPVGSAVVKKANQSRMDYAPLKECFRSEGQHQPLNAILQRLQDPSEEGAKAREDLHAAINLKNREFNAQGIEMNHRYESRAVLPEPHAAPETWGRDKELYLQPTTRPGAKLPHIWLVNRHGQKISTLDLVGKGQFTLITGISGKAWTEAAKRVKLPYLRVVTIGTEQCTDAYGTWRQVREVEEAGAILVRPDGYVGWRHSSNIWSIEAAMEQLTAAMRDILCQQVGESTRQNNHLEGATATT